MKTTKFKDYQNEIVELRRYFHAHPELSLKEYSTADYIEKYLNKNGMKRNNYIYLFYIDYYNYIANFILHIIHI